MALLENKVAREATKMGYLHVPNLYRPEAQQILEFKRLFACEKLHGTSTSLTWKNGKLTFFSGGENHARFMALFDVEKLTAHFVEKVGFEEATVYGEAYGGKQQGMSATYGKDLRFTAFDVQIGGRWLAVLQAHAFVHSLDLEFVDYAEIPATLEAIDAERDKPSTQAARNGVGVDKIREGVVLRPPFEVTLNNGARLIAKHKRAEFAERATTPIDPAKAGALAAVQAIVEEWVTPMRLEHVIDHIKGSWGDGREPSIEDTSSVIKDMVEDVLREGAGEVADSKDIRKAIGSRAVKLFKARLEASIREVS